MKTVPLLVALFALPLAADSNLWFDPPNPTSRTFIKAHFQGGTTCPPSGTSVRRSGQNIVITVKQQTGVCPLIPIPADGYSVTADLGFLPAGIYDVTAGPEQLLVAWASGALTVGDAESPLQVVPNVSGVGGSNGVTITGAGIAPVCAVAPCPAPVVMIGETPTTVIRQTDTDHIVVQPSPHTPGTVDVTVTSAGQTLRAVAAFHYSNFAPPFDPAFFEPILFPVVLHGPGAYGALWTTDVTLRNENDFTLPVATIFDIVCFPFCDPHPGAHSTRSSNVEAPYGYVEYVPRQAAPKLFFSTLARDLSRQAEDLGTELPVVREKDFFDGQFTILNVPADARYRVALRLYRLDGRVPLHIRIRPMMSEDPPLVDTFLFLTSAYRHMSAYVGDLVAMYPQLAGKGPLRIEVDGTPQRPVFWGFVSVTNNTTQHVTVISPQ